MLVILILIILLILFYSKSEEKSIKFIYCPIEGYWQKAGHVLLIGINMDKKIIHLSSTISRQSYYQEGKILKCDDEHLIYKIGNFIGCIEYHKYYIVFNGIRYDSPEFDNIRIDM